MRYHAGHIRMCFYSGVLLLVLSLPELFSQSRLDSVMDTAVEVARIRLHQSITEIGADSTIYPSETNDSTYQWVTEGFKSWDSWWTSGYFIREDGSVWQIADFFIAHLPGDFVPPSDFDLPLDKENGRDAAAAAIACSGRFELSRYAGDDRYRQYADSIMMSLCSPGYLSVDGTYSSILKVSGNALVINRKLVIE